MRRLPHEKRAEILRLLVEGNSLRGITRIASVSINTVTKLLIDAGKACHAHHHAHVRNLNSKLIQVDEIWSFVYAKAKNVAQAAKPPAWAGSIWTWTAMDAEARLLISWCLGTREAEYAHVLMSDLATRVTGRVQITSDGLLAYQAAAESAFGSQLDFSRLVKGHVDADGVIHETTTHPVVGNPDLSHARTSYMERLNLTIRMSNRRYNRKTNAFSKRSAHHAHQVAIFTTFYNWCRRHMTLKTTPAVAAGLADRQYDMDWLIGLVEARDSKPGKRGPYKPRQKKAAAVAVGEGVGEGWT